MEQLALICNAHLDPVWLWRWPDGAAEAISTFRVAADFCEEYDGFVFNHNEAILYQWIEKYDPALFARIQSLVKEKKWHIMGGWFLQPDCNMVSSEGMIRQIEAGRRYFYDKFQQLPKAANSFDAFGHSRGLVQILKKTGYPYYLFCRPLRIFRGKVIHEWGYDSFRWKGYDGSSVIGHRYPDIYGTDYGQAADKLEEYLQLRKENPLGLMLWGIGDHGGGPSRLDLEQIQKKIAAHTECRIRHSTPEAFFEQLDASALPERAQDLNSWAPGCYTTQTELKHAYRQLESMLFESEKMASAAALSCGAVYPAEALAQAQTDLLFAQFHDILAGTVVPQAAQDALDMMKHGMHLLRQVRTDAFFALCAGQRRASEGTIPILAYNPHPYPLKGVFQCEFCMQHRQPKTGTLFVPELQQDGKAIACQLEHETSEIDVQWQKKVVFSAILQPESITRFDCRIKEVKMPPEPCFPDDGRYYRFDNGEMSVIIDRKTGLLEKYAVQGTAYLGKNAFLARVMMDDDHSIGTFVDRFQNRCGQFSLAGREECSEFCGVFGTLLEPVHMVEEGPVRSVVEAVFAYESSHLVLQYILPREGSSFDLKVLVDWNEKNRMLKLCVPTLLAKGKYLGQVMGAYDELPAGGKEVVAQKWTGVRDSERDAFLGVINDGCYGSDYVDGTIEISLLRSPRYGCLMPEQMRGLMYNRGYVPHTDQGSHLFRFRIAAGKAAQVLPQMARLAQEVHEPPYIQSYFPGGTGDIPKSFLTLDSKSILVDAFRRGAADGTWMLRLANPTEEAQRAELRFDETKIRPLQLEFKPFEIKTVVADEKQGCCRETDMLENQYASLCAETS